MNIDKPYLINDDATDVINLMAAWVVQQDQPDVLDVSEFQCVREQILAELMGLGSSRMRVKGTQRGRSHAY